MDHHRPVVDADAAEGVEGVVEGAAAADAIRIQLPEIGAPNANVVHLADGGDADAEAWERQVDEVRRENPQVAMLLDAPHEPPIELHHMLEPVNVPQRPRKKRSFWTISKPFPMQPERCAPIVNGWRAVQFVQPEQRSDYFANYLLDHLSSKNYPNGQGLPHHWGQL